MTGHSELDLVDKRSPAASIPRTRVRYGLLAYGARRGHDLFEARPLNDDPFCPFFPLLSSFSLMLVTARVTFGKPSKGISNRDSSRFVARNLITTDESRRLVLLS